jgi:uridine monophosphate synthetase
MDELTNLMLKFIEDKNLACDQLCGVPYTALPLATLLSVKMSTPMLIRRKEAKSYGTKKLIEGKFQNGEMCLIIEDVVTTGTSILETTKDLNGEGLIVENAIVVVDRQQGGSKNLSENSIQMHSLFTLPYLIDVLKSEKKIDEQLAIKIQDYISQTNIKVQKQQVQQNSMRFALTFGERAKLTKNESARKLFEIMEAKKTNLCLAVDVTKSVEILNLADSLGPLICVLKTHIDIVEDFNDDFVKSLKALAVKHNFMIMEDRKFADIGNTVSLQFSKGIYKIADWADLITAHSLPGDGIFKGLKNNLIGIFVLAEMSCEGNLMNQDYGNKTMEIVDQNLNAIAGIVCQSSNLIKDVGLIQLTPGCKLDESGDNMGQKYDTPEHVVIEKGADIAVVGRGIIASKNPIEVASTYRDRLWSAYIQRVEKK